MITAKAPLYQMQGQIVRPIRLDVAEVDEDVLSEGIRRRARGFGHPQG